MIAISDSAVHPIGLSIRPGMIGLGQFVDDAVFMADLVKDVHSKKGVNGLVAVIWQAGKCHPVVRQNDVFFWGYALITPHRKSVPFIFPRLSRNSM